MARRSKVVRNSLLKQAQDQPFSYECNRCHKCCHGKRIPLNPYEILLLARTVGISTGELIRDFTEDGVALKFGKSEANDACVFLSQEGCMVHSGRPAACRSYPLGVRYSPREGLTVGQLKPEPGSAGVYGKSGTARDYLASQGFFAFVPAAELYRDLWVLLGRNPSSEWPEEFGAFAAFHPCDVDAFVSAWCDRTGEAVPEGMLEKVELHIRCLSKIFGLTN